MRELITFVVLNPGTTILLSVVVLLLLMYFLRQQAHACITYLSKIIHSQLRLAAKTCSGAAHRIRLRNHEVVNALARELMERHLEREFMRVESLVEKDLASYQTLAASINQQINQVNEDYEASAHLPPAAPEWIDAVDAIAALEKNQANNEVMAKILSDVHDTVKQHHKDVMREHRWTVGTRHKLLSKLRPHWRKLEKLLEKVAGNIEALEYRLKHIDQQMDRFEMLQASPEQGLMSSVLMRFLIATLFVAIGVAAMVLNYQLLLGPVSGALPDEMIAGVPLASYIAGIYTALLVASATIALEGLRITHLLPLMAAMTQKGRYLMIGVGAGLLTLLALFEAFAVAGFSMGVEQAATVGSTQMIMFALAFVTPVMLSLVIVPFEYFLYTVRPTVGVLAQNLLHLTALMFRMLGSLSVGLGKVLVQLYDAVIFIPLKLEQQWIQRRAAKAELAKASANNVSNDESQMDADSAIKGDDDAAKPAESGNVKNFKFSIVDRNQ